MDIFLSWSQSRSEMVAQALHDWIPLVLQPARPWLSRDIAKGARWDDVVSRKLETCDFGIVCLTPENLHSDWLLFEAGALSKKVSDARVCTFLLDLKPGDVSGPLAKFQHTAGTKEDTRSLIATLNLALGELQLDAHRFAPTFEQWWPELEQRLSAAQHQTLLNTPTNRRTEDKVDEILLTIRSIDARLQQISKSPVRSREEFTPQGYLAKRLREVDWSDATPRLLAYTARRLGPNADRAGEYVERAVSAILERRYNVPGDSAKSVFALLCAVIDDLISSDHDTRA